jgi:hypothetical protein
MKHHQMIRCTGAALVMTALLTLGGCASTAPENLVEEVNQVQQDQLNFKVVGDALATLSGRMNEATKQDWTYYAPVQMEQARQSQKEAIELFDDYKLTPEKTNKSHSLFSSATYGEKTLEYISVADQSLDHALRIKQEADTVLVESFKYLVILEKLNAAKHFSDFYHHITNTHDKLVGAIAKGDIDVAKKGLPELLKQEQALEVKAAQRFYLDGLKKRLAQMRDSLLDREAPASMKAAVAMVNRAGTQVSADPRHEIQITKAVDEARFTLDVVESVASEVKKLRVLNGGQFEPVVLHLTSEIGRIGRVLEQPDVRNLSLDAQFAAMVKAASVQASELATASKALSDVKSQLELSGGKQTAQAEANIQLRTELATVKATRDAMAQQINENKLQLATKDLELIQLRQQLTLAQVATMAPAAAVEVAAAVSEVAAPAAAVEVAAAVGEVAAPAAAAEVAAAVTEAEAPSADVVTTVATPVVDTASGSL